MISMRKGTRFFLLLNCFRHPFGSTNTNRIVLRKSFLVDLMATHTRENLSYGPTCNFIEIGILPIAYERYLSILTNKKLTLGV